MKQNKFSKIEFRVNKEYEKEVALFYLEKREYYFSRFIKDFPELEKAKKLSEKEAKEFISKEIDKIYLAKETELLGKRKEIIEKWDKVKEAFFKETENLFEHKWPLGEYITNISPFGMYRLKLGTKIFSIPSNDYAGDPPAFGHINFVIIHEMLHIFFENYYKEHFSDETLTLEQYRDLLELVNDVILNLPQFKEITKWVAYPYPQHKKAYEDLKEVYVNCSSMKEFVEKAVEYIRA